MTMHFSPQYGRVIPFSTSGWVDATRHELFSRRHHHNGRRISIIENLCTALRRPPPRSFMKLYETINLACSEHNNRLQAHMENPHGSLNPGEPLPSSLEKGVQARGGGELHRRGDKTDLYFPPSFRPFVTVRQRLFESRYGNISPGKGCQSSLAHY